jgi:hypothetical protein
VKKKSKIENQPMKLCSGNAEKLESVSENVNSPVKVSCFLSLEGTKVCETVLCGSESLKALLNDGSVFAVIVCVHLNV